MNYPIVSMKGRKFRVGICSHNQNMIILTCLIEGWILKIPFNEFIHNIIRCKINYLN